MSGSVLKNATFVTPVKSAQFEEMAEATPHASKAAAVLQIEAAELTALSVNPKNGSKTVPFKRPIRVRFGGKKRDDALRCPFGAPKSFEASKTDRVSFNISIDPDGSEATFAQKLDSKVKGLLTARKEEFLPKAADIEANWHSVMRPGKDEYWPTLAMKVQVTGSRQTRYWVPKEGITTPKHRSDWEPTTMDRVDWSTARVAVLCEARNLWLQARLYGVTVDARDIYIYPEDNTCPFSSDESEEE